MPLIKAGARRRKRGHWPLILALFAAGCSHGEPLDHQQQFEDIPHQPTSPTRLTLSPDDDLFPAWLPDGSGILYSYEPENNDLSDRCLGVLPAGGGQRLAKRCHLADRDNDSTNVYFQPAPRPDGMIAWLEQHSLGSRLVPDYGALVLGDLNERVTPRRLWPVPYVASSGNLHATILNLRWLSATQLGYIGADVLLRSPCQGCPIDSVVIAREVMLLGTDGSAPVPLPNSAETTSIWPTADSAGLYYTVAGDGRVYRRPLAGGAADTVYDFSAFGIARDVSVVGNRLAAIVAGSVQYGFEPLLGMRQIDSGGVLMTVDLSSGAIAAYDTATSRFRRPVVSPDGRSIVAEGVRRTGPNRRPDLWRFQVP